MSHFLSLCRFLGHLYAAEALISLDRISDAITHLNPENICDVSMGLLTSEQDQGVWGLNLNQVGLRFCFFIFSLLNTSFIQVIFVNRT